MPLALALQQQPMMEKVEAEQTDPTHRLLLVGAQPFESKCSSAKSNADHDFFPVKTGI
jgi:hypothetical protein